MTPNNAINSFMHWRIQRRVKTDLGKYYRTDTYRPGCAEEAIKLVLTKRYSLLLYYLLTDEFAIDKLNYRYKQIIKMTTTWHSEENQKYVKFDSIWMWANATLNCPYVLVPHDVRVKIVRRLNKMINDKRTKLCIPTGKKYLT